MTLLRAALLSGALASLALCQTDWPVYGHDPGHMRFSPLKQITAKNVKDLRLAWSYDNRTAAFRVVGQDNSLRIECRVAGADCNPYLAFAASLAAGLDGIARRTEPPAIFTGDAYAAGGLPRVPGSLREASDLFEKSSFARETFGPDVVEHYLHFARMEQEAYDRAVTDWERQRYFERI